MEKKMKKLCILITSVFLTALMIFSNMTNASASENTINYNKTGLGYSINAVKTQYLDPAEIRTGSPILDEDWLKNLLANREPELIYSSETNTFTASNFFDINVALNTLYSHSAGITMPIEIFTLNAQLGYGLSTSTEIKAYLDRYYYALVAIHERYAYSLPRYSSDLSSYKSNLDSVYVRDVTTLFTENTQEAVNAFFDTYGTHLIGKGIYGGKLEAFYGAYSKNTSFSSDLKSKIESNINLSISNIVGGKEFKDFSLSALVDSQATTYRENFRAKSWGGTPFVASSFSSLNSNYNKWASKIDEYPGLIGTSSDGLIPLWNFLPSNYDTAYYKNKMITWYEKYTNDYNNAVYTQYFPNDYTATDYKLVRAEKYRINDSGRFVHNKHDVINLNEFSDLSYEQLKSYGYRYIDVYVKLTLKEINKGYPYICIYNNDCLNVPVSERDSHKVCPDIKYMKDISTAKTDEFTFVSIPIEKFDETKQIVLRYGASGSGEDDWENWNLYVKLIYRK